MGLNAEGCDDFAVQPTGVGKTTLVRKIAAALEERGVNLQGFYTEEVRQQEGGREGRGRGGVGRGRGGPRIGFDVVSLDGQRGILARVERYSL